MFGVYAALSSHRYWILDFPFNLYVIGIGVAATIAGLKSTIDYKIGWLLLVEGAFYLLVGICLYFHTFANIFPGWFLEFIPPLCLVFGGVCQAGAAFQLRKQINGGWSLMAAGGASLLFGLALVVMLRILWDPRLVSHHYVDPFVGVYGFVAGVLLIVAGVAIRGKKPSA